MAATEETIHWWGETAAQAADKAQWYGRRALIEAFEFCGQRESGEIELLDPGDRSELARIEIVGFVR